MNNIIRQETAVILNEKSQPGEIYNSTHTLYDLFVTLTGISAHEIYIQKDIELASGRAISPAKAAHCLLEFYRTAIFIRGIRKAILQLKDAFPNEKINILYAGCGPYATLLTPLTSIFSSEEITFHLMDINPISLESAKTLYQKLALEDYIADIICADATTYKIKEGLNIHLTISETMLHALMREPQVAIMQNLIPQLPEKSIFIPEEIVIDAQLLNGRNEMDNFSTEGLIPERINLGEIFRINQQILKEHPSIVISIPEKVDNFNNLYLMTTINVFENEVLKAYNCSLTLPVRVLNITEHTGKKISFKYVIGNNPKFEHTLL